MGTRRTSAGAVRMQNFMDNKMIAAKNRAVVEDEFGLGSKD